MLAAQVLTHPPPGSRSHRTIHDKDEWKRHFSFSEATTVGHGCSGLVFAIDEERVIKMFTDDEEGTMDLERERMVYDKLQSDENFSDRIVRFEEQWESGLILERLAGTLRQHLRKLPQSATPPSARQWARETCEGLAFLHQHGVLHSDFGCQNILLGANNHVKLCDFAGSKIGNHDAWISYEVRSQRPSESGKQPTEKSELFALGSVIFEIWTCRPPYASEPHSAVLQKFSAGEFPISYIKDTVVRGIVARCWTGSYGTATEVHDDLDIEFDSVE